MCIDRLVNKTVIANQCCKRQGPLLLCCYGNTCGCHGQSYYSVLTNLNKRALFILSLIYSGFFMFRFSLALYLISSS